jgi:hypothetical protein
MNRPCPTFGHKRAHVPLGNGGAVPAHQQVLRHMGQQGREAEHAVAAVPHGLTHQGRKAAIHGDATHHRHMIPCAHRPRDGGRPAERRGADQPRPELDARRGHHDPGAPCPTCRLLSSGQTAARPCCITASSRWAARAGPWGGPVQALPQSRAVGLVRRAAKRRPEPRCHSGTGPQRAATSGGCGPMG